MHRLKSYERLQLVKFVCTLVWADLEVREEERAYVSRLVRRLELSAEEREQVEQWLRRPPAPEEVDPNSIPRDHRQLFLDTIRGVLASDLEISTEEKETMQVLQRLMDS